MKLNPTAPSCSSLLSSIKGSLRSRLELIKTENQPHNQKLSLNSMKALLLLIFLLLASGIWILWPKANSDSWQLRDSRTAYRYGEEPVTQPLKDLTEFDSTSSALKDIAVKPVVFVSGAVVVPGVYELAVGARASDAVAAAGGFTEEAETNAVNLASTVKDGQQIVVPTRDEIENGTYEISKDTGFDSSNGCLEGTGAAAVRPVNINTADIEVLDTLPGIGPAIAEKIVRYRSENGPFRSTEDLKNVSGIGESKYLDLVDRICV